MSLSTNIFDAPFEYKGILSNKVLKLLDDESADGSNIFIKAKNSGLNIGIAGEKMLLVFYRCPIQLFVSKWFWYFESIALINVRFFSINLKTCLYT